MPQKKKPVSNDRLFVSWRATDLACRKALLWAALALRHTRHFRLLLRARLRSQRFHRRINAVLVDLDAALGLQLLLQLCQVSREVDVALFIEQPLLDRFLFLLKRLAHIGILALEEGDDDIVIVVALQRLARHLTDV